MASPITARKAIIREPATEASKQNPYWQNLEYLPKGTHKVEIISIEYVSKYPYNSTAFLIVKAMLRDGQVAWLELSEKKLPFPSRDDVKEGMKFIVKVVFKRGKPTITSIKIDESVAG